MFLFIYLFILGSYWSPSQPGGAGSNLQYSREIRAEKWHCGK